ncbi:MAG: cell division protein ZipA [Cellvibrionaceae bacterium]|nr:cell division protein ZipA [Cellvibrionaceae bacterium]
MTQEWLTIIIALLIVVIIIDGIRRMRNAKRDSIKMSLRSGIGESVSDADESEIDYGSEFPNGGARPSERQIDSDRIKKVRSRYNFGDDIPAWRQHLSRGKQPKNDKVEPSLGDADPLLDEISRPAKAPGDTAVETVELGQAAVAQQPLVDKSASTTHTPVQASLDLERDVPMLMDALGNDKPDTNSAESQPAGHEDLRLKDERETIQAVAKPIEPQVGVDEEAVDTYSANKPRYESKYIDHSEGVTGLAEVLVIHLRARDKTVFTGENLLELILDNGLRFGAMDIFHFHAEADGEGPVLFSMANMVKPGSFDLHTFEEFATVGLSFFMTLPLSGGGHLAAFEQMLAVGKSMAQNLDGELKDENRSVLTGQTIEHYRERIRDFSRRQQLEKNK